MLGFGLRRRHHGQDHPTASASSPRSAVGIADPVRSPMCSPACRPSLWQFISCIFPDRARRVGDLRAADGGSLALVRTLSRARGHDRRQRQLYRRRVLAVAGRTGARRPMAGAPPISPSASFCAVAMTMLLIGPALNHGAGRAADHANAPPPRVDLEAFHQCADGDPLPRQHLLLRGDVDAAGSHRRLLRRSRLWRGARRRNAVADAGVRHHQPHRLGIPRRQVRRHARRC